MRRRNKKRRPEGRRRKAVPSGDVIAAGADQYR